MYGLTSYNCVGQDIDKLELAAGSYDGPIIKVLVWLKGLIQMNSISLSYINNYISFQATGGGAFKYADVLKEKLGVTMEKEDEMDCLVAGLNFLLRVFYPSVFITVILCNL